MPLIRPGLSFVVGCGAVLLWCSPALADDASTSTKQACVAASTDGQALRDSGKLREAREKLVACARDECPVIVRKYCAETLAQVESRIPSVVFRVQEADGTDVTDARVAVDNAAARPVDGSATTIDPGEHVVRFEHPGEDPVEMHVVVAETEKGRIVTAHFAPKPTQTTAEVPPPTPEKKGVPIAAIALAGVGVLGVAGFTYFGLTAKSDLDNLRSTCAPTCASSDLDSVKQKALIADISLGVGVVAVGAAAWIFFSQGSSASPPAAAAAIDVRPTVGGAVARFGGHF